MPVISKDQALSIASMVELTDKDFQPLQFIKLEFSDDFKLKAYATDRYVMARATYDLYESTEPAIIYLDRGAIKFIKDNAKTTTTFTLTQGTIATDTNHTYCLISDGSTLPNRDYDMIIEQALESKATPELISMNLSLIAKIQKLTPANQTSLTPAKRRVDWTIRVGAKHDPVVLTDNSNTFTALAQPLRRA